jgi:hypothetical protein
VVEDSAHPPSGYIGTLMMSDHNQRISQAWHQAQQELGLVIEAPFVFTGSDGSPLTALVLVRMFGSPLGTLITSINDDFDAFFEEAKKAGYYCSALNPTSYAKYDKDVFMETLDDWGWYGEEEARPEWYTGKPWGA